MDRDIEKLLDLQQTSESNAMYKMCEQCETNLEWMGLSVEGGCEGCKYELIPFKGWVLFAPLHFDRPHDLILHTPETCLIVRDWTKKYVKDHYSFYASTDEYKLLATRMGPYRLKYQPLNEEEKESG